MMKKNILALVLAFALSTLLLCACSKEKVDYSNVNLDVTTVKSDILKTDDFPEMIDATPDNISLMYDLDATKFEGYSVIYAGSGGYADEIAIIKLKSSDEVTKVTKVMKDRVTSRANVFKGYAPLEFEKLNKAVVEAKGDYVFLAVCDNPKKAEKVFDDAFKK